MAAASFLVMSMVAVAVLEATGGLFFPGDAAVAGEVRLGLPEGHPEQPPLLPWGRVDGGVEEGLRPQGEEGGNAARVGAHVVLSQKNESLINANKINRVNLSYLFSFKFFFFLKITCPGRSSNYK